MKKYDIEAKDIDSFRFYISYYFSDELRAIKYGNYGSYGSEIKFSALYEMLVTRYNSNEYFIQTYFDKVYHEGIGSYIEAELDEIIQRKKTEQRGFESAFAITSNMITQKGLLDRRFTLVKDYLKAGLSEEMLLEAMQNRTKAGTFDKRFNTTKDLYKALLEAMQNMTKAGTFDKRFNTRKDLYKYFDEASAESFIIEDEELEPLTRMVKEDLLNAFSLGLVPVNLALKSKTIERRVSAGIDGVSPFFATGQLLNDVEIVFEVKHNGN